MTNGTSIGWRKHNGAKEICGEGWKVPEEKTISQQGDLKVEKAGAVSGVMRKILEHLLIGKRYSQDIINSIWDLSPAYGILLDEVEGSRRVLLWS